MTDDEWEVIAGVLEECWPGEWTERTGPAYRMMLDSYPAEQVAAALRVWTRRGEKWRPSAGELVGLLTEDAEAPTWAEAFAAIFNVGGIISRWQRHGWSHGTRTEYHELIEAFVEAQGVARLAMIPVNDETWGEKRRADLGREWEEFLDRARSRQERGLPLLTGGRPAGELRRLGEGSVRGALESGNP